MMLRGLLAVWLLFLSGAACAQDKTPDELLHTIYGQYRNDAGPGLDDESLKCWFTPELFDLVKADADEAVAKQQVPKLNGDPFIDAQDWNIEEVKIVVADARPDSATGIVTFRNFGEPFEIRLDLVRRPEGWRIAEIYAPSGTLHELLKQ